MKAFTFEHIMMKKKTITCLDDSSLQSQTKTELFTTIYENHHFLRNGRLKAAPDKTNFLLRIVKFHGEVISKHGILPVAKQVQDIKNLKARKNRGDVKKFADILLSTEAISKTFISMLNHSTSRSRRLLLSNQPENMRQYLWKDRLEAAKTSY